MNELANLKDIDLVKVQNIAIVGSSLFLLFILLQIKRKRMKEEYSLLWLFIGAVFLFFSIWRQGLDELGRFVGVAYPPAALFLILLMAIFLILIQFSIILTKLTDNNRQVTQEHSILKLEFENLLRDFIALKNNFYHAVDDKTSNLSSGQNEELIKLKNQIKELQDKIDTFSQKT